MQFGLKEITYARPRAFITSHSRHGLEDALDAVSEGELVYDLLLGELEVDLPGVLAVGFGQLHVAGVLLAQVVEEVLVQAGVLHMVRGHLRQEPVKIRLFDGKKREGSPTFSSPLISTLICSLIDPETDDLSDRFSKLYHTSISPDRVRTSMMVWPRKSSLSLVSFCLSLDLRSLSSSHTRTLMRSEELWHSLGRGKKEVGL